MSSSESYTRREFVGHFGKTALKIAATGALWGELAWSSKIIGTKPEITEEALSEVEKRSEEVIRNIGINLPTTFFTNEGTFKIETDVANISQSILRLAYLDGGLKAVDQVIYLIRKRKLIFLIDDFPSTYASFSASRSDGPCQLGLSSDYLLDAYYNHDGDKTLWHEYYHLIQYARNPNYIEAANKSRIGFYLGIIPLTSFIITFKTINNFLRKKFKDDEGNRRSFLKQIFIGFMSTSCGFISAPIAVIAGKEVFYLFEPYEQQAYFQIGMSAKPLLDLDTSGLLPLQYMDKYKGKTFSFQEI